MTMKVKLLGEGHVLAAGHEAATCPTCCYRAGQFYERQFLNDFSALFGSDGRIRVPVPCCHVSGQHDPTHFTERRYVCARQKACALDRMVERGIVVLSLESDPDCGWCEGHGYKATGEVVR